jgi:hypothetical protein
MAFPMMPDPRELPPDLESPNGLPVEPAGPPAVDAMAGAPPMEEAGIGETPPVENMDFPGPPVGAPGGDVFGMAGAGGDPRDATADMLARIIASVGARHAGGQ